MNKIDHSLIISSIEEQKVGKKMGRGLLLKGHQESPC